MVKRYRVRRDGGTGGRNATGASHRALIHVGWWGAMSEEAARVSGVCPPSRTAPPPAPEGGKRTRGVYTEGIFSVGLARMMLPGVSMGGPDTTGWRGPLVKARPCKVKGLDPVVKLYKVRRDGGPGGM